MSLSAERSIRDRLREMRHDKWGFLIYRCTYADDAAWARFKDIISERSNQVIVDSEVPELANSLEWTFVEDRPTLENASKELVRTQFRAWTASGAENAEQPRAVGHWTPVKSPRYEYFIHVDEGVLRSIVSEAPQPPAYDLEGVGYVNLVDASWRPHDDDSEDLDRNDQHFESIEGCRAEDVGWMKIASHMVGPSGYDAFTNLGDWQAFYKRPPQIVTY